MNSSGKKFPSSQRGGVLRSSSLHHPSSFRNSACCPLETRMHRQGLLPTVADTQYRSSSLKSTRGGSTSRSSPSALFSVTVGSDSAEEHVPYPLPPGPQPTHHDGIRRQCIPVYPYRPLLCEKSSKMVENHRHKVLKRLYNKLDPRSIGVVDLFQLKQIGKNLDKFELAFIRFSVSFFVQKARCRRNEDLLPPPPSGDPNMLESENSHHREGRTSIPTIVGGRTVDEDYASRIYRRQAKELNQILMINVDPKTSDFNSTPMLFVPEKQFVKVLNVLLTQQYGSSEVDLYREESFRDFRFRPASWVTTPPSFSYQPHVLEQSRRMDSKRRQNLKAAQKEKEKEAMLTPFITSVKSTGTIAKTRPSPSDRFDEQIDHFVRKRRQFAKRDRAQAQKKLLEGTLEDDDEEKDENVFEEEKSCTFHPILTPYPKYLEAKRKKEAAPNPKDPMKILKRFCEMFGNDQRYEEEIRVLKECTFQPNIHKYISNESELQQKKLDNEANRTEKSPQSFEDIYAILDHPFDRIFEADVRHWLRTDGNFYGKEKEERRKATEREETASTAALREEGNFMEDDNYEESEHEGVIGGEEVTSSSRRRRRKRALRPKKGVVSLGRNGCHQWELEGRLPLYRGSTRGLVNDRHVQCIIPYERVPLIAIPRPRASSQPPNQKALLKPLVKGEVRWQEGLRGGYLPLSLEFQMGEGSRGDENKRKRYGMRDWGRYIRLKPQRLQARLVPNREIIQEFCSEKAPQVDPPLPTYWNHTRRYERPEDPGPDAHTYTRTIASCWNPDKGPTRYFIPNQRNTHPFPPPPLTTFSVPTPAKIHQVRQQVHLYGQLGRGIELGDVRPPPKVVAVRRDALADVEQELEKEPPILYSDRNGNVNGKE